MNNIGEYMECIKKVINFIKKYAIGFVILFVILIVICLPYWYDWVVGYLGIKGSDDLFRWEVIKGFGYVIGALLLAKQIAISNRRAKASEKSAETASESNKAVLDSNTEQRYHNAAEHLGSDIPVIRIGAIYNLYHISKSTKTYDKTIFDMFCAYLSQSNEKTPLKEKQIILDKLFRGGKEERVLENPGDVDLSEVNLSEVNLSGAYLIDANLTRADLTYANLTGANLTGADLTGANLTEATLTGADLPGADLPGAYLTEATLTEATLTGADLTIVDLTRAYLTGAYLTGAYLTGAYLTEATLTGAELTFEQLSEVESLYNVKGLDKEIEKRLKKEIPKLFDKPAPW